MRSTPETELSRRYMTLVCLFIFRVNFLMFYFNWLPHLFFWHTACGRVGFGIFDIPVVFLVKSAVSQLRFWYSEPSKRELPHKPQCHRETKKNKLAFKIGKLRIVSVIFFLFSTKLLYKMVKLLLEDIHFWNCETYQKFCWLFWTCNIKIK